MSFKNKIIAVGGGKGGVGKSVVCANMAVTLALTGQRVVLVDADFGASSLHALLGISSPKYGFREYFDHSNSRIQRRRRVAYSTPVSPT